MTLVHAVGVGDGSCAALETVPIRNPDRASQDGQP